MNSYMKVANKGPVDDESIGESKGDSDEYRSV